MWLRLQHSLRTSNFKRSNDQIIKLDYIEYRNSVVIARIRDRYKANYDKMLNNGQVHNNNKCFQYTKIHSCSSPYTYGDSEIYYRPGRQSHSWQKPIKNSFGHGTKICRVSSIWENIWPREPGFGLTARVFTVRFSRLRRSDISHRFFACQTVFPLILFIFYIRIFFKYHFPAHTHTHFLLYNFINRTVCHRRDTRK